MKSEEKHLAYLLDSKSPYGFMVFPGYYEDLAEKLHEKFEEVTFDIATLRWEADLQKIPYKVFKQKQRTTKKEKSHE